MASLVPRRTILYRAVVLVLFLASPLRGRRVSLMSSDFMIRQLRNMVRTRLLSVDVTMTGIP